MGESGFIDGLVKVMLSWARWLTDLLWASINSTPSDSGLLAWFGRNWLIIALILIVGGIVIDWLIWMIRWRPYWLWFRKKQIIYAEEGEIPLAEQEAERRRMEEELEAKWDLFARRRKTAVEDEDNEDPFEENTLIPTAEDRKRAAREYEDIYAPRSKEKKEGYHVMFDDRQKSRRHVMFEADFDDPFAENEEK